MARARRSSAPMSASRRDTLVDPGLNLALDEGYALAADRDGLRELTGIDQPVQRRFRHADAVQDHSSW